MNIERLNLLIERIRASEENVTIPGFDMESFFNDRVKVRDFLFDKSVDWCGTTFCAVGHALMLGIEQGELSKQRVYDAIYGYESWDQIAYEWLEADRDEEEVSELYDIFFTTTASLDWVIKRLSELAKEGAKPWVPVK